VTSEDVLQIHIEGFNRALEQQDYASLEAIYSDRYMLVRPDGSVLNKQQVLKDLREGGLTFHAIELESAEVEVLGSAALLTATSKTLSSRNGKRSHARIRLVAVYAQEADAIRLVHFQSNILPEEPVAVSEVNRGAVVRKVETQRFTVISTKPFDDVVANIKAAVGHPNMSEFWQSTQKATSPSELNAAIQPVLGKTGLMEFVEFDHGMIIRKGTDSHTSRIMRLVIGNPLIMKEMAKHVPDAGSYAPVTVLVDERTDGVHLSYDRMASLLAPYGNHNALSVAHDLDAKVENLLRQSA
jgi:uncharacterized protein (DUF302 family)/ketosteroid isomerase-like protein